MGSCNTLNDVSSRVCFSNKTEDLNLIVFNMITGINESKKLKKHTNLMVEKWGLSNSNKNWNSNKCRHECKNPKEHQACVQKWLYLESCLMYLWKW